MRHASRGERWTWFLVICLAIPLLGRLAPLQLVLLGVGLVSIGVGVLSTRRHARTG